MLSFAIAIILAGLYSNATLNAQLAPDTNPPMATVIARYPGAAAQDVVTAVVKPMEHEFGTLDGIRSVKSTAQDNMAIIQLQFGYEINVDEAAVEIQNAISGIRDQLPMQMQEPRVLKFSVADKPIMTVSLKSESLSMQDVRQLAEDRIGFELQLVEGVASVEVFGGYRNEVQVRADKNLLDAHNLNLQQLAAAIGQSNIQAPGGSIQVDGREVMIRIQEGFGTLNDLHTLRIPLADGNFVLLGDLADIQLSVETMKSGYRFNGEESIALLVTKRADSNTIEVVENVANKLEELETGYPFVVFEIAQDDSVFTTQMVSNMKLSVFMAILLTVAVIVLFIGKLGQSLAVSISMPLVFLSTLTLMKFNGMEFDMVTLSALILSIGFVVDGAVVVVENIIRHQTEMDKDIVRAAIDGTNEVAMPNIAGATTTLVVLVPLLFIQGFVGEMFRPLATTLIYAITSSVVIALTIIPLLTVMLDKLKADRIEKKLQFVVGPFNRMMNRLMEWYLKVLTTTLKHKVKTYLVGLLLFAMSMGFLFINGLEMLPLFDSGVTYIAVELESGSSLQQTKETIRYIESLLDQEENVISYDSQIGYEQGGRQMGEFGGVMGVNQGKITVNLTTRRERKENIWDFQERLRTEIDKIPDINRYIVKEHGGTAVGTSAAPLDIRVSGPDQDIAFQLASELEGQISEVYGTTNVYISLHMNNQQLNISINHEKAHELGISNAEVAVQIYQAMEGTVNTTMDLGEISNLNVSIGYQDTFTGSQDELMNTRIMTPSGPVPLRHLASVEISDRASLITREDLEYTVNILGFTHSRAFSHIVRDIKSLLAEHPMPQGYQASMTGEQEDLSDAMGDMFMLISMAVIFVYLLLVPQFKSFIHPITVMGVIPLVMIGVAPALGLTGNYVSMPVLLGLILLAGTVVNNAILLLDYTLSRREEGDTAEEAVAASVKARFRPIMMTALSDIAGMLPLAMQLALGSERFAPLAIVVIGGMAAATFLTTIMVPLTYVTFENLKNRGVVLDAEA